MNTTVTPMPSVTIMAGVGEHLPPVAGIPATKSQAQPAWRAVSRAVIRIGPYRSVDFGQLVNAVMRSLGGWVHCCGRPKRVFDGKLRRAFLRAHVAFSIKGVSERDGRPLWGIHDAENYRHGFHDFIMAPIEIRVETPDDFIRN